jgi:small-conductance mechanosensitive channel
MLEAESSLLVGPLFFSTVERICLRSTELRTLQGQIVLIPNKEVFQNPIINYTLTRKRRIGVKVAVSYEDNLEKARRIAPISGDSHSKRLCDAKDYKSEFIPLDR